jgi:hypothetical protein
MIALTAAPDVRVRGAARARAAGLRALGAMLLGRRHLGEALRLLDGRAVASGEGRHLPALRRWPTTCLYRSLAGYARLRSAGAEVQFVIGVGRHDGELVAHAWLERQGAPLGEPADPRRRYAVAFVHPSPAAEPPPVIPSNLLRPSPDVLLTELADGTGVLLDLRSKFYFALNRTGVAVWKLLAAGQGESAEQLAEALARDFQGAPASVRDDVAALVRELLDEGLLLPPEPGAGPGGLGK